MASAAASATGRLGPRDAVAGQEVVVVGVGLEGERGPAGKRRDELLGRAGRLFLGLGHRHGLADLGLGGGAGRALRAPSMAASATSAQSSRIAADGVVVGRDDVVELIGVDVGVARADDRDLELVRLGHGDPLAMGVDDEDRAGQALHLAHAADGALELDHLLGQLRGFLLGHALEVAGLLARLELLEEADALLDGREVREHAAEPALLDVGHVGARRLGDDRLLGLLLGPDEQDLVAAGDGLADGLEGDVQALDGLGEIDDVDPVALREDERAHLGVPAAGLVAEVDSGFEQLPHRNGRHGVRPPVRFVPPRTPWFDGDRALRPGTTPIGTVRV